MSNSFVSKVFQSPQDAMAVVITLMANKAWVTYEPLADGQVQLTVKRADAAQLNVKPAPAFIYTQEGGSSSELYLHGHETETEAVAGRINCAAEGSYRTGEIVELPPCLRALSGEFYDVAETLLQTVLSLKLYK